MPSATTFVPTQHAVGCAPLAVYTYDAALSSQTVVTPIFLASHGLSWSVALEDQVGLPDWRGLAPELRLIRYDAQGHGRSGGGEQPEPYQWCRQAADMAQVLDWVHQRYAPPPNAEMPDIILGGCSMSSAVALHLMAQVAAGQWSGAGWVSRIKALVLTIPPAGWSERAEIADHYRALRDLLEKHGLGGYLKALSARQPIDYLIAAQPRLKQLVREHAAQMLPGRLSALYEGAMASDYPAADVLRQVSVPTLLLARRADAFHPAAFAQTLAELLPNAALFCAQSAQDILTWPKRVAMLARAADVSAALTVSSGVNAFEGGGSN